MTNRSRPDAGISVGWATSADWAAVEAADPTALMKRWAADGYHPSMVPLARQLAEAELRQESQAAAAYLYRVSQEVGDPLELIEVWREIGCRIKQLDERLRRLS